MSSRLKEARRKCVSLEIEGKNDFRASSLSHGLFLLLAQQMRPQAKPPCSTIKVVAVARFLMMFALETIMAWEEPALAV